MTTPAAVMSAGPQAATASATEIASARGAARGGRRGRRRGARNVMPARYSTRAPERYRRAGSLFTAQRPRSGATLQGNHTLGLTPEEARTSEMIGRDHGTPSAPGDASSGGRSQSPRREFHVSAAARARYHLDDALFELSGNLILPNLRAVRALATRMTAARRAAGIRPDSR